MMDNCSESEGELSIPNGKKNLRQPEPGSQIYQVPPSDPEYEIKIASLKRDRFDGLIRNLRAEAQNLQASMSDVKSKYSALGKDACAIESIPIHEAIFTFNRDEIEKLLKTIHEFLEDNPPYYAWSGDVFVHIDNKWERIKKIKPDFEKPPDNICDVLEKCMKYLCEIVYYCDILTVPNRLSLHLEQLKAGYALNFHEEFEDEFCSKDQEDEMLKFLARHPTCIQGLVDTSRGLIFKVEPEGKRWPSYVRIISAVILAGLVIIAGITLFKGHPLFPLNEFYNSMSQLFIPYTIVICGSIAHVIIGAMKEMESSDARSFKAVDDWLLWIHIKEVPILRGIVVICIGFGVLMAAFPTIDNLTFFVAGYSIDSIGDLLVNKFDTVLTTKGEQLKTTLSS